MAERFLILYGKSAITSLGLFWTAFWAFALGYFISSLIQVFVTREGMRRVMGRAGVRSIGLGTFFGFISSSCSFAALATTRALFAKGAGLIPSLAFLLASTNLVIELGIIIALFLSWQFVVAEYVGGLLLILFMWLLVRLTLSKKFESQGRKHARRVSGQKKTTKKTSFKKLALSKEGWLRVARRYLMEWSMVWKDVTIGFSVAGIIASFVPKSFFHALFIGADSPSPSFFHIVSQSLVGPIAAFFTFIGSMGNIPLAAVLFDNGVAFAGIIAFMFSDLIVFPVIRIQITYYGIKMAAYIQLVFFAVLVCTAIVTHYAFSLLGLLPHRQEMKQVINRNFFNVDYTLVLNLVFISLSAAFIWLGSKKNNKKEKTSTSINQQILLILAFAALAWLAGGVAVTIFIL